MRSTQREHSEQEEGKLVRVRLSLKGRPLKSYVFSKAPIVIGRSPDCDVFLDNPGVSREHLRIERTPDGSFEAIDLGSANGTLLNSRPLKRAYITQDDVIQIGKFTLWIGIDTDRRAEESAHRGTPMGREEGTTVLSTEELERMVTKAKETFRYEEAPRPAQDEGMEEEEWVDDYGPSRLVFVVSIAVAFVAGGAAGAICMRLFMH